MNLFKNPIVPVAVDTAWETSFPQLAAVSPSPMLVLTRPFETGSKEEATLVNMLKACGFGVDAYTVLSIADGEGLPWKRVIEKAAPRFALLLGVPPASMEITALLPANAVTEFGGVAVVWTGSLQYLTETEAARKALWKDILQPLFKRGQ